MKYFIPLLAILFITLKLTGTIAWSWWWVLLPVYGIPLVCLVSYGVVVWAAVIYKRYLKD